MRQHGLIGTLAIVFGALSLLSGGTVILGPQSVRDAAGDIVLPVLWFNMLSGPAYIAAGLGILRSLSWSRWLAWALAAAIGAMLMYLVAKIVTGSPWEPRTLIAMTIRLAFWIIAARIVSTKHQDAP